MKKLIYMFPTYKKSHSVLNCILITSNRWLVRTELNLTDEFDSAIEFVISG